MLKNKNFFLAISTLVGTIIGAGMFGIPYAFSQSGFVVGMSFLFFLAFMVTTFHLYYGEIVLRTSSQHRMVGYAEKYFGKNGKIIASFSTLFGFNFGLLVYILLGGEFLYTLFGGKFGGTPFLYSIGFFIFGAFFIFRGLKFVSKGEFFLTLLLLVAIFFIFFRSLPYFDGNNFEIGLSKNFFLPYGVILFALGGASAIPELQGILSRQKKKMKWAIIFGTLIPAIIYAMFVFVVIGVTGQATSPEALDGLNKVIGNDMVVLGAFVGTLALFTSFLVIGLNLKETYQYDYKISHFTAWMLALFVPFGLFLAGFQDFILIMSLVGALGSAIDGTLVVAMHERAKKIGDRKPEFSMNHSKWLSFGIAGIFILGAIVEIIFQLKQ